MAALVRKHAPALGANGRRHQITSIDVTAHSLGSALADALRARERQRRQDPQPVLYTFASPMVGDATFAAAFDALQFTSWRIVNKPDLVPQLPAEFLGYQHIGVEKLYDLTGIVQANPDLLARHGDLSRPPRPHAYARSRLPSACTRQRRAFACRAALVQPPA